MDSVLSEQGGTGPVVRLELAGERHSIRLPIGSPLKRVDFGQIGIPAVLPPKGRNSWLYRPAPIAPEIKNQLRSARIPRGLRK